MSPLALAPRRRRLAAIRGARWPFWPRKVRTRLALLYAGLFLISGSALLGLTYGLVAANLPATSSSSASGTGFSSNQLAKLAAACKQPHPDSGTVALCKQAFSAGEGAAAASIRQRALDSLLLYSLLGLGVMTVASGGLGWFVANASHELRTPLTVMRTAIDVALAKPSRTTPQLEDMAARVRRHIDRAENMIEALLVLAISDQGMASRELLDLSAVAEDALELAASGITRLGLKVEAELSPAETTGDQQLIERMVWNLVDNAVRHNEPGGWIRVTTGRCGPGVVLEIANSGAQVPADAVPTLFEPLRRIGSNGRADGGVGLGLSIAQSVSTAHGAELDIRSQPEGGLFISVVLPSDRLSRPGEPDGLGGQREGVFAQETHRGRPVTERRAQRRVHRLQRPHAIGRGRVERRPDRGRIHHRGDAAVHHEHLAVDRLGRRAGQVHHQRRDVLGRERVHGPVRRRTHQLGRHGGTGAGADGVGADAVPRAAARGRDGEGGDASLSRGVVGLADGAEQECLRRGVHDPRVDLVARPVPLLPPVRGGEPRGHEVPAQVDPDDQVPLLGGHREDHPVAQHPGVVDQDVQPSVLLERRRHQQLAGRPLRHVPGRHHRLAAVRGDLVGHRLHGVPRQVVEHQPRPGPGQRQRLRPAESVPRPGHDGHPAG
jgi:Histidine kinase-, DNA gyrase B-, and HSP90-like ATPase/His Kinase A (phospho-acceptor) domain